MSVKPYSVLLTYWGSDGGNPFPTMCRAATKKGEVKKQLTASED